MKRIMKAFCVMMISVCLFSLMSMDAEAKCIKTKKEAVKWLKEQDNKGYDLDNAYSYQCSDFVSAYMNWLLTGDPKSGTYGVYNANYYPTVASWNTDAFEVYENYLEFEPQAGDIFVTTGTMPEYGHTGVVISSSIYDAVIIDQNSRGSDGNGYTAWLHTISWTGAYSPTYFIRPKFSDGTTKNIFADVNTGSWQYDVVKYVYDNNIMRGKGTNSNGLVQFDPDGNITRAEFVTVLHNMENKPAVSYKNTFKDVYKDKWYTNPIIWAYNNDIVAGSGKYFGTHENITREQLAQMLYNYAKFKGYKCKIDIGALAGYTDGMIISSWAKNAMNWAVTQGIMKGKGLRLDPKGAATRAECAAMIRNFKEAYK